jgi:hypothetical protein
MQCPQCHTEVAEAEMNIEANEDQVEINFTCPGCQVEQFTLLSRFAFEPID